MKNTGTLFIVIIILLFAWPAQGQGWEWATGSTGGCEGYVAATDPWGATFIAGRNTVLYSTIHFGSILLSGFGYVGIVVVKYDGNGQLMWAMNTKNCYAEPLGITDDGMGGMYLLGYYTSPAMDIGPFTLHNPDTVMQVFVARYSPDGVVMWAHNLFQGSDYGSITYRSPYLYMAGAFKTPSVTIGPSTLHNTDLSGATYDVVVTKMDTLGNPLWAKSMGGTGNDHAYNIKTGANGNIYVLGHYLSPAVNFGTTILTSGGVNNMFLARFDSSGNEQWAKSGSGTITVTGMALDAAENIYINGSTFYTSDFGGHPFVGDSTPDMYIIRYDSSGSMTWTKQVMSNRDINGFALATDPCGTIWANGSLNRLMGSYALLDGDTLYVPHYDSVMKSDPSFIAGWTSGGVYIGAASLSTAGDDIDGIGTDGAGNVYIGADYFYGPYDIAGAVLSDPKMENICAIKYNADFGRDSTIRRTLVCFADSTVLQAPPGYTSYLWNDARGGLTRTCTIPGIYTVYCTGACNKGVYKEVFTIDHGHLDTTYAVTDTTICSHAHAVLYAPAGYFPYVWSNGGTAAADTIDTAGVYWVAATGTCQVPTIMDTFKVMANNIDLSFSLGPDTIVCAPLLLEADVPGAAYLWQDGSTGSSETASHPGKYSVTASEQNCFNEDDVLVNFIDLAQHFNDTFFCKGQAIQLTLTANVPPGAEVEWSTGSSQRSITVTGAGNYWATVTEAACTGSDTMTISTILCDCTAFVPNAFSPNDDGLNDYFYPLIDHSCAIFDYSFAVYNRWGQLVYATHDLNGQWDGKFKGVVADMGLYMYYVEYRTGTSYEKHMYKGDVTLVR